MIKRVFDGLRWTAGLAVGVVASAQPLFPPPPEPGATVPPAVVEEGARIRFATPVYDFGKVKAGEVVRHSFVFTNTGTSILVIREVRPSCGCTTSGQWDKEVAPGGTGSIPIQLNTAGFGGAIAKSVQVTCNDPTSSQVSLRIQGTAWKPLEVTPATAYFNVLRESPTNQTKVIRIVNNVDEPLKLSEPECTNHLFKAELRTVKEGREFELHITALGPFTSPQRQAVVNLKTSSPDSPLLSVRAYAMVQETVTLSPNQLILPAGPFTNVFRQSITIRNAGSRVLALSEPAVNVPGASVNVQELQPGRLFALNLEFPAGFQLSAGQKVEVKVKSSHPDYPELAVPVYQRPRVNAPSTPLPVARPAPRPPPVPAGPQASPKPAAEVR